MKYLIDKGVKPVDGRILVEIAKKGSTGLLKYFIGKGLPLKTRYIDKALYYAVLGGNSELIKYMVRESMRVYPGSKPAVRVLRYAVQTGNLKILKYIFDTYNSRVKNVDISELFDDIKLYWGTDLIKYLLEKERQRADKTAPHKKRERAVSSARYFLVAYKANL